MPVPQAQQDCTYEMVGCVGPYDAHPYCEQQVTIGVSAGIPRCMAQRQQGSLCPDPSSIYPEPAPTDPCSVYLPGDKGVSQKCFDKLWSTMGCDTIPPAMSATQQAMTYSALNTQLRTMANTFTPSNIAACYSDASKVPYDKIIPAVPSTYINMPNNIYKYDAFQPGESASVPHYIINIGSPAISGLLFANKIDNMTWDAYLAAKGLKASDLNIAKTVLNDYVAECSRLKSQIDWSRPTPEDLYNYFSMHCDKPVNPKSCPANQTRQDDGSCKWDACYKTVTDPATGYKTQVVDPLQQRNTSTGQCEYINQCLDGQTRNTDGVCVWKDVFCGIPNKYHTALPSGQPVCADCPAGTEGNYDGTARLSPGGRYNNQNTYCVVKGDLAKCQAGQNIDPYTNLCESSAPLCNSSPYEYSKVLKNGVGLCVPCPEGQMGNNATMLSKNWVSSSCVPATPLPAPWDKPRNTYYIDTPYDYSTGKTSQNYQVKPYTTVVPNPCDAFKPLDTNVSQDCFNTFYKGFCSGTPPAMTDYHKSLPRDALFSVIRYSCSDCPAGTMLDAKGTCS